MAKAKGFELVPRHIPVRQRSSFYKEIITDFLSGGQKSVVVAGTDRKPATLVQGLRKVIQSEGLKDVKVLQRSQDVYLSK
jgi:methylmalonyl-CoA mutase cobalamin-binding subunit